LAQSVETTIANMPGTRNTMIPLAHNLFTAFGEKRANSRGVDLDDPLALAQVQKEIDAMLALEKDGTDGKLVVGPIINGQMLNHDGQSASTIFAPADRQRIVGRCVQATAADIELAISSATKAQLPWQAVGAEKRAQILDVAADLLEQQTEYFTALISLEAGRTLADGVSEVREAVDFCRYYALQARLLAHEHKDCHALHEAKGLFLCISPWNFPLAIFMGQVVAALVTGNAVIAKPAEQTPIIAALAVQLLHQAGVPVEVLQLITGIGREVGPILLASEHIAGVAFTGSTETAQRIQADLVKRAQTHPHCAMPPFIAETGGQNVMIVDSTALPEQVVDTVIQSAFLSAGQRCSALRVLYLQQDIADGVIDMLKGAIATLQLGYPWQISSDIGPVIDEKALALLQTHCARMQGEAAFITQGTMGEDCKNGVFIAPQVFEIKHISQLEREVFGPVLHIIRFAAQDINQIIADINATGYGLTLGVHSRLKAFSDKVFADTYVGNTYINRNMVGAVVGVNPFGGHGLSGTGFKAGGPHYLLRFSNLWPSVPIQHAMEQGVEPSSALFTTTQQTLISLHQQQGLWNKLAVKKRVEALNLVLENLKNSEFSQHVMPAMVGCKARLQDALDHLIHAVALPGPTGETNELTLHGRGVVLLVVEDELSADNFMQAISALVTGNALMIVGSTHAAQQQGQALAQCLNAILTKEGQGNIVGHANQASELQPLLLNKLITAVISNASIGIMPVLAQRKGAIIPVIGHVVEAFALLPYVVEKTLTNNIVATGGNAMLLNLQE
jgi:RHH-type transcriptional regulator, proline utilization regulon repressor / proline dehydrogenase / delta 1-pyrroline-5-carboxylate dehydrogenase